MALSAVKGTINRVLDKNLQDLVRGIRNHKGDETKYINQCLDEIRNDLKQSSVSAKSNALAKLIYLQMLGCDISWAVFNVVEIISSHQFTFKRIGYLAAAQSFHYDMDVIMLTTNQIHKDLSSMNTYDSAVALSGLSCFVNQELAMNLYNEILMLTISSKPYLRKKSVLLLYKVFLHHPEALPVCFPRLKEKLEDPDAGVQCAAVNVVCELARKNPRNYLSLAPVFFNMMKHSTNNWVLIKIIKLFGALTPLEPRLGKKLIEPLTNLIHSTSAMSLLYECINTIVAVLFSISSGVPDNNASIQLCVQKLRVLIEDSDQNLKYLGLMAMGKILRHHAKSLQSHRDLVLACLHDKDESVRLRALSLLHGMITKRSLVEIVQSMVGQIGHISASSHYCSELVAKVIHICTQENYHYITSFEWYISMLVELARMDGVRDGGPLADQLIEVAIRVPSVRGFCVEQMAILVDLWPSLVSAGFNQSALHIVMEAAAWICGEYAQHLSDARHTLTGMFSAANRSSHLAGRIQAVLLLNAFKLYCSVARQWAQQARDQAKVGITAATGDSGTESIGDRLLELTNYMVQQLAASTHSPDLEVQERAVSLHQLCSLVVKRLKKLQRAAADQQQLTADASPKPALDASGQPATATAVVVAFQSTGLNEDILALIDEITGLFVGEINRVAPKAQRKVPIPAGLDLDAWINSPPKKNKGVDGLGGEMRLTAMLTPSPVVLLTSDSPDQTRLSVSPRRDSNATTLATNSSSGLFPELASTASPIPSQSELVEMRMKRLQAQQNNPHYLKPKIASVTVQGGDVGKKTQVEVATPADKGKVNSLPSVTGDSAVRECAKPEQFVNQIRQQFLQLDTQENDDKSTTKQYTRANRKSVGRRRTAKKAAEAQAEAAPSILVLADYDRPEGVSSGGTGDSSPERRLSLAHPLDDPLAGNGLLPSDLGKSPSKANSDKHRKSADTSVYPPQRRRVGKTSTGAPTGASGQRTCPELGRVEVCPPNSNDHNNTTPIPSQTEAIVRTGVDHKAVHRKSKAAHNHHRHNHLDSQTISDRNHRSWHTTSDSVFAPAPMSPDQLVKQLSLQRQQSLSSSLSGKIPWSGGSTAFPQLVSALSDSIPCTIVERIGQETASLFAIYGSQAVPVCCMLKHSPRGFVHYGIKSVTPEAAGACAARVKALVASTAFSG